MKIGKNIRSIRELKNYKQDYMADQLGITQRAYSKIENDEVAINVDKLYDIANILQVQVSELLPDQGKQVFNNFGNNKENGLVVNNYQTEKELYEKLLTQKDALISQLEKHITHLEKR
jgi:transcriptional regulator with XRE-family HTH domain